jgi:predicted amidophosphoribosyltransferase
MIGGALPRALERFLLPNGCVVCDRVVGAARPDELVCGLCRSRLRPLAAGCGRCGQPLPPVGPCRFCAGWPPVLGMARSAVWLDHTARPIVHHLKYDGLPTLAAGMAEVVARRVPRPDRARLVPIPLSARRQRERGYNQAAALARALGTLWRLPVAERLLSRTRDTGTQTALTPEARLKNVAGAFLATDRAAPVGPVCPAPPGEWPGGAVILIDDVLTTGATLVAAAMALGGAGWPAVGAVTFARALPYELRAAG